MSGASRPVRVLVGDNRTYVLARMREAVQQYDDLQVIGEANSVPGAVRQARRLQPDIVLAAASLPAGGGLTVARLLTGTGQDRTAVALMGSEEEERLVPLAARAGARGFIRTDAALFRVAEAIRVVAVGEAALTPSATRRLLDWVAVTLPLDPGGADLSELTVRELRVLELLAEGSTTRDIAKTLLISEATVRSHIHHLLAKLGASGRGQAVALAFQHGLVQRRP